VSLIGTPQVRGPTLLRDRSSVQRVTNIELFFDLVYVFAVTQLSHYLLGHANLRGALQAGLLLGLAACAAGVVTAIAVTDRLPWVPHPSG
jgi:low temperature requirement protein LtrA